MSDYIKREDAIFIALQQPLYSVVSQIKQLKGIDLDDYVPRDYYEKVVSEMAKRNVEAADIVRCSECKWWLNKEYEDGYGWCKHWLRECNADDFCSYGERSE